MNPSFLNKTFWPSNYSIEHIHKWLFWSNFGMEKAKKPNYDIQAQILKCLHIPIQQTEVDVSCPKFI